MMTRCCLLLAATLCLSAQVDAGAVLDVTDETFDELVVKPSHDKDVMILFYDLKRGVFKNIFEGVAKAFPSSKLVFAQYDCHKHDPPAPFSGIHHDKVHYPAVYYYRQKHEPEHYTGLRMQATIIDWIKAHPHIKHAEL